MTACPGVVVGELSATCAETWLCGINTQRTTYLVRRRTARVRGRLDVAPAAVLLVALGLGGISLNPRTRAAAARTPDYAAAAATPAPRLPVWWLEAGLLSKRPRAPIRHALILVGRAVALHRMHLRLLHVLLRRPRPQACG